LNTLTLTLLGGLVVSLDDELGLAAVDGLEAADALVGGLGEGLPEQPVSARSTAATRPVSTLEVRLDIRVLSGRLGLGVKHHWSELGVQSTYKLYDVSALKSIFGCKPQKQAEFNRFPTILGPSILLICNDADKK
jgi:hypothetical protein